MAKVKGGSSSTVREKEPVHKHTSIGGGKVKMSSMNKQLKASYKKYRGQGRGR